MRHLKWFALALLFGGGCWGLYMIVQLIPDKDKGAVAGWGGFFVCVLTGVVAFFMVLEDLMRYTDEHS